MDKGRLFLLEEISVLENVRVWQQELLRLLLRVLIVCGVPALVVGLYGAYENRQFELLLLYAGAYASLTLVTFWQEAPYVLQTVILLSVFYGMGMFSLIEFGLGGAGSLFLLPFPLLAVLFLGRRARALSLGLVVLSPGVIGWAFSTERFVIPVEDQAVSGDLSSWLFSVLILGVMGILLVVSPSYLVRRLVDALGRSRELVQELEQRVAVEQEQRERLQRAKQEIEQRVAVEQEQREHLQRLYVQVREAANDTSSAAAEIMAATSQQSTGANEQLEAITQTITTVDEVKTIAEQLVARAQEVTDGSLRTVEVSHNGQQAVQETIASMAHIKSSRTCWR